MLYHLEYITLKKVGFLFALIIANIPLCNSQNTTLDTINQAYKEIYHTLDAFVIDTLDGREIFTWKILKEKVNGTVKFSCAEQMDVGTRDGIEGKICFKDGLKHGIAKIRDCKTGTNYEINYHMGLLNGHCKISYNSAKYIKGKREEINLTFYETNFIKGNGFWKNFYCNGNLKETGEYKSGKKEGEWLYYSENNNLYLKQYFKEGILIDSQKIKIQQTEI